MKLEVGMYVRTKWGINKINEYVPQSGQLYLKNDVCVKSNVIKASHNIIDLIEVGDYVNESRVVYFMIDEEKSIKQGIDEKIGVVVEEKWETTKYLTKDIKSIVTKEMYSSVEYRVEAD